LTSEFLVLQLALQTFEATLVVRLLDK
jgi:hypothetical protein